MYVPDERILKNYADVLIKCALNSGKGIKKGETVILQIPECAKPILLPLQEAVLEAGGNYITQYLPDGVSRMFYEKASDEQLKFFPDKMLKGRVDEADHLLSMIAENDKKELVGIPAEKLMTRQKIFKPYFDWRNEKENAGKLTWTLALYGTESSANEAGLSLKEYWEQIISACYLDKDNPIEEWKKVFAEIDRVKDSLNKLEIEKLHIESKGIDLWVGIGEGRRWLGGTGRNIPSFEVYISPDCRLTEGSIEFDQPLYRYGNLIKGIKLVFEKGKVVEVSAEEGEDVLREMIKTEGANMVGEYSLTDVRLSKISKFMAETLYDENYGGKYGNTHLALGNAYKDSYPEDLSKVSKEEWQELGYNESAIHTDIVSTTNRKVTAFLKNGQEKLIYSDGKFLI